MVPEWVEQVMLPAVRAAFDSQLLVLPIVDLFGSCSEAINSFGFLLRHSRRTRLSAVVGPAILNSATLADAHGFPCFDQYHCSCVLLRGHSFALAKMVSSRSVRVVRSQLIVKPKEYLFSLLLRQLCWLMP